MSNPGWPDPAALPFLMFGGKKASDAPAMPLAQGLSGGMDLIKKFWGDLPGGTALPGFLVPTLDVEELDKRISDLRAAESWIEVNLNMLRATIQGLEVQRNTIAAIQSLTTMSGDAKTPVGGLAAGWPGVSVPPPAKPAEPVAALDSAPAPAAQADPKRSVGNVGAAESAPSAKPIDTMTGAWLGFMQDQFAKVAQAALSPVTGDGKRPPREPTDAKQRGASSAKPRVARKRAAR